MLTEDQAFWFTISLFAIAAIYYFSQGWLIFIQMAIVVSVVCAAIYWEWPGSGYAHVFVGITLAFIVTVLPLVLWDMGVQMKSWLAAWRRDWLAWKQLPPKLGRTKNSVDQRRLRLRRPTPGSRPSTRPD